MSLATVATYHFSFLSYQSQLMSLITDDSFVKCSGRKDPEGNMPICFKKSFKAEENNSV